jgi:hypothetical protein
LGINEQGAVVGHALFDAFDGDGSPTGFARNPFLWLPRPLHGLTGTGGLIRLAPFSDDSNGGDGEATDINSAGDIVGVARSSEVGPVDPRAFLLSLDGAFGQPAGVMQDLGVFNPATPGGFSRAEALSDRGTATQGVAPPILVGGIASTDFGPCDNSKSDNGTGFIWTPAGGLQPRDGTGTLPCGWVLGLAPDAVLAGGTAGSVRQSLTAPTPCNSASSVNGARWPNGSNAPELPLLPNFDGTVSGYESVALDVRNAGVGAVLVGFLRESPSSCPDLAWRWDITANGMATGTLLAPDPLAPSDSTRATALNKDLLVVGLNSDAVRGLVWATPHNCFRLDDLVVFSTAPAVASIREAHDINDNGWIVGTAFITIDPQLPSVGYDAGVVLIPPNPCPGDVDWDGDVDATDLALVQTAPGGPCAELWDACLEDVDGDGVVDGDDVIFVLRYLRSGGCQSESLDPTLAATWRAAGGDAFLASNPIEAAAAVAHASVPGDQSATFFNLIDLLGASQ